MVRGDRSALDAETKTLYKEAGIMHIFAVSGLHITFLGMGLYCLLRKAYIPIIPAALFGVAIMVLYGMMIGMPVSAVRAVGMFVCRLAAECIGRTYDMLTALAVCAVSMLAVHPLYLCHAGFLLSFSAVCAVALLKPAIQPDKKLPPLLDSLFMSLAITVFTLPVQLYFYYEAPVYAVFLNLAVIPLAGAALTLGTAALIISFLLPQAAALPAFLVHLIFTSYEEGSRFLGCIPGSVWTAGKPTVRQLAGFCLLVGTLLLCKKLLWKYKMGLLCGAVLLFAVNGRSELRVTILDVGQGDCICMELPDGSAWLYDGGSTSVSGTGAYRIEPFLKSRGITRLNGIFVSHSDEDHVNGVEELLERNSIAVGLLALPCTERQGEGFLSLLSLAQERNIPVLWLEAGMEWESGGVNMSCLHPSGSFAGEGTNASSTVIYLSYGRFSMLLTGDVEGTGEE
ncbi:MAG: ComEC/Rec2 family competence protein, partial [Lachnospiraceae bacterium]|nr:ComEC/Rec2 family competence protein [Lachnospiraceae bacterium]